MILFNFMKTKSSMETRDKNLLNLRPEILSAKLNENMSCEERFQNTTLRPIIKLQSDLLFEVFKNYIAKHKNVFYELSLEKRIDYIENTIHKDMKFRNSVKGMIIGQFTCDEFLLYIKDSSSLNKRMMNIVKDRLLNNIQVFDVEPFMKAI